MVVADINLLIKHLAVQSSGSTEDLPPRKLYSLFKNMTPKQLNDLMASGGRVLACTMGRGDTLMLPAGWLFFEAIGASSDLVGLRLPFLDRSGLAAMEALSTHLDVCQKPSTQLIAMIDAINNSED